jgi:O-acetyl-ADP-ribose deacetylase (regulator of RNase III)
MLKKTKGDLLKLAEKGKFNIIVQGCNCFCRMGSGIAKQIRETYPAAYIADCQTTIGDREKLGTFTVSPVGEKFVIVNAYTQYDYNRNGANADVFEYAAFQTVLDTLFERAPNAKYGFPYIGMGLAGGDSERIIAMLEDFAAKVKEAGGTVTLVEFKP